MFMLTLNSGNTSSRDFDSPITENVQILNSNTSNNPNLYYSGNCQLVDSNRSQVCISADFTVETFILKCSRPTSNQ